jgi:hypothetical protein
MKNEQVDHIDHVEVSLPGNIVRLIDGYPFAQQRVLLVSSLGTGECLNQRSHDPMAGERVSPDRFKL